jgi:hypothetical protein
VTPCVICTVHVEMMSVSFLVDPQNQIAYSLSVIWSQNRWDGFLWFDLKIGDDGFLRFDLKTGGNGFSGLALKPVARVFRFRPQNRQLRFGDLDLKIITTVSWFGPQNQVGYDLSVALQNRQEDDGVGHASSLAACFA